jgi:ribonuclease PH
MTAMPDIQIRIDCDVIQADGGTRTASITGAYVALHQACTHLMRVGAIPKMPLRAEVAAISCGIYKGLSVLDLDYAEDSGAELDANFVLTGGGEIVEIQMTAEEAPFPEKRLLEILHLARKGVAELVAKQRDVLGADSAPRPAAT